MKKISLRFYTPSGEVSGFAKNTKGILFEDDAAEEALEYIRTNMNDLTFISLVNEGDEFILPGNLIRKSFVRITVIEENENN